jgi:hypothetical protein
MGSGRNRRRKPKRPLAKVPRSSLPPADEKRLYHSGPVLPTDPGAGFGFLLRQSARIRRDSRQPAQVRRAATSIYVIAIAAIALLVGGLVSAIAHWF